VLAGVLVRPPVSPYDTLILDQGSSAGVEAGMRAEGAGGLPIGIVESASANSSRVILYSAPGKETESWAGEARIPITLRGEGSGAMSATVAREAGIVAGDLVYVSGPGAIAIGSVVAVDNDPSSPRSRINVRPLANPFSMTWVTLVP
ncbi:MAG TPA: rod shape-determining protein MreC, partial [Candidatus Paceibacterota bacterium]|nr:rod shape-determining protein MreC [Candidatus Paceibacterota bacterium]